MIELVPEGYLDYTKTLRTLSRARGAVSPILSETITPMIDVGPQLLHVFSASPRLNQTLTVTPGAGATISRFLHNPQGSGLVYVLDEAFVDWDSAAVNTHADFIHLGAYVPGAGAAISQHVNVQEQLTFSSPIQSYSSSAGAITLNSTRFGARSGSVGPMRQLAIFPGYALQVAVTNNDAAGRTCVWSLNGRIYRTL